MHVSKSFAVMDSLKDPKTWIPEISTKDCSKKICNIYCTKWCNYVILPSPPPPLPDHGGTTLSPVVIAIIALTGSFFLLFGYFVVISRYCFRNNETLSSGGNQETLDLEIGVDGDENYVPWLVLGKGLDEALIKSITICKYKRGDGMVSCTACSVCLGEFEEDEGIRLLPKCCHAFHVYCIDTWLKTHSNCPLCRAQICSPLPPSPPPPPPRPPQPRAMIRELGGSRDDIREEQQRKMRSTGTLCQSEDEGQERQDTSSGIGSSERGLNFVNNVSHG